MSTHTPGPWRVELNSAGDLGIEPDICIVPAGEDANAHLIATAPELLIALNACIVALKLGENVDVQAAINYGLEVLAKAEGK
jgi:hypothetical protein